MLSFVSVNWYSTGYYVLRGLDWGVVMALSIESVNLPIPKQFLFGNLTSEWFTVNKGRSDYRC